MRNALQRLIFMTNLLTLRLVTSSFRFRQFIVRQHLCAMKVGTDGTLLGAWAAGGKSILDIGTGTGLIALMMAQRFDEALVTAIDIDGDACRQAFDNVDGSPFCQRIKVRHCSLQDFVEEHNEEGCGIFDAIVCNPPFYDGSLPCPDKRRSIARHDTSLSCDELFAGAARLLAPDGEFSLIIPASRRKAFETAAVFAGMHIWRVRGVKTTQSKPASRCLMSFGLHPFTEQQVSRAELVIDSDEYKHLTEPFYLSR